MLKIKLIDARYWVGLGSGWNNVLIIILKAEGVLWQYEYTPFSFI